MTRRDWNDIHQALLAIALGAGAIGFITYVLPLLLMGLACGGGQ